MRSKWGRSILLWRRGHSSKAGGLLSYVRNTAEELTGQTEVSLAQAEVREKREELKTWRQLVADETTGHEATQQRLRHVYAIKTQLYQAQRRDLAALQAINSEEESLLSEEQSQGESLESLSLRERACFDALGDAILASHEKERAQSERMKYYSRLGSVLGAVVGFAGSNLFLRREVRHHHRQQAEKMEEVERMVQELVVERTPDAAGMAEVLRSGLQEMIVEENKSQMKELVNIRGEMSQFYTADSSYHTSIFLVTGLGLFVLSYTLCAVTMALNGR